MAESAITILKITASVALASVFLIAINGLLNGLWSFTSSTLIGEFLGLISMCLPFHAGAFFHSVFFIMSLIFSFVIAKKIYSLSLELMEASA